MTSETCGRVFSAAYDKFSPAQSIQTDYHRDRSKLEVVFHDSTLCGGCDFSMDVDSLRVAQLILAIGHTRDRSERPLLVCCRHLGKCLESLSRTSNSWSSSKYRVPHTPETAPKQRLRLHVSYARWQTVANDWTNFTWLGLGIPACKECR